MPATRGTRSKRSTKAVEPDEIEDDLEELEADPDEDADEEPAPKRRGRPAKATAAKATAAKPARRAVKVTEEVEEEKAESYGTTWLVEYVNDQLDTDHDGKSLRVLLRKATEAGILDREDNSRYQFSGADDRKVAKILKFVREQEKESAAAEKSVKLKPAAAKTAPVKPRRRAADDDDEEQPAPARRRGRKPKTAAPVEDDDPDMPDFDEDGIDEL